MDGLARRALARFERNCETGLGVVRLIFFPRNPLKMRKSAMGAVPLTSLHGDGGLASAQRNSRSDSLAES